MRSEIEPIGVLTTDLENCLHIAIDSMASGVIIYDQFSRLVFANARYCEIYGFNAESVSAEAVGEAGDCVLRVGMHVTDVIRCQARALKLAESEIEDYLSAVLSRSGEAWRSRTRALPDGRTILTTRRMMQAGYYVATHEDISERVSAEKKIRFMAAHDSLTGLPNRAQFIERLDSAMARVRRGDRIAVHMLDLDRLKHINDSHGHAVGDQVLQEIAKRLKSTVRETDLVARLGGDEFAILQVPAATHIEAERLAQRITATLSRPITVGNLSVMTSASIGIAFTDESTSTTIDLMVPADAALYKAKNDGRGVYRFFEERLNAKIETSARIESNLRHALVKDRFEIHYQPIINLERGRVETCEALLRMRDQKGKLVPPGEFVPVAEVSGLIGPIGDWVLRKACADAADWPEHISVAVNVSTLQFKSGYLMQSIEDALTSSGLAAQRLEIEITESLLLDASIDVENTLHTLRETGVRIVLDNFGTGNSALKYLMSGPFDKLKIDRSIVTGIPNKAGQLEILHALTSLGANLGITTTVEGVETIEQLRSIHNERCSNVQGYIFARPTPASELLETIDACGMLAKRMKE